MKTNIDDGGPAFPHDELMADGQRRQNFGLSLRDYFAAKAMHAEIMTNCLSEANAVALVKAAEKANRDPVLHMALNSYEMADAMLKARAT